MKTPGQNKSAEHKNIVIFGASGAIGGQLVNKMLSPSHSVYAMVHRPESAQTIREKYAKHADTRLYVDTIDVRDAVSMQKKINNGPISRVHLDTLIYSVGDSSRNFSTQIQEPLHKIDSKRLLEEFELHVLGFHLVCKLLVPRMNKGGHIIVMSSAITRFKNNNRPPPWLHAGHYAIAKAALNEMVKWLRIDPLVVKRAIKVHLIAPGAIDSPFHAEILPHQRPPKLLSVEEVVMQILETLDSKDSQDKLLVAD